VSVSENLIRVYLPGTAGSLALLRATGRLDPPELAHAVTPALREWYVEGDEDELEYVAFTRAAQAALALLATDVAQSRRRVVISADIPADALRPMTSDLGSSEVAVTGVVPVAAVAAVHIDSVETQEAVGRAASLWSAAQDGEVDAVSAVDAVEDYELEWYDPSELDRLV